MWIWQQPDWPGRQQKASQVFRYDIVVFLLINLKTHAA